MARAWETRASSEKSIHLRAELFSSLSEWCMMLPDMRREELPTTNPKIQVAVACWAVAAFAWYFHQFYPVLSPILRGLLHRIWR
jgi:hypothetical protein